MKIQAAIATLSWIDPKTGLPEVDSAGAPGRIIARSTILAKAGYRFSNFLEAWIEVDAGASAIIGANFSPISGMYRGPSYWGTDSAEVGNIGQKITHTQQAATFRQVVGCRTMAPEKIGRTSGAVAGVLAYGGAALPPLALIAGAVGYKSGRKLAEEVKVFPPIWTELELTINLKGSFTHKLLRHSLFPSVSYYAQVPAPPGLVIYSGLNTTRYAYALNTYYDAVPVLDTWYEKGWGSAAASGNIGQPGGAATPGNPWSMTKPTFTSASSLRTWPQGY
jgi:hypothetical protein